VIYTDDEAPVGLVILSEYRPEARSVALSLMIGECGRWGRGLGTDALLSVLDACWATWNLHRVWLRCEAFNERAQRLYRRCGFVHEATLRDATFCDGAFHDVFVYGLLEPAVGDAFASADGGEGETGS
jgi:RimJ/RimL family protein N-acetyltransferase